MSTEDESIGLIILESPDPETDSPLFNIEPVSIRKDGHYAYNIYFKDESLLKQVTETAGFNISGHKGSKWEGRNQTFNCILGDDLDLKRLFKKTKKMNGSVMSENKEVASDDVYCCEKVTVRFLMGITGSRMDPINLYKCYYETGR